MRHLRGDSSMLHLLLREAEVMIKPSSVTTSQHHGYFISSRSISLRYGLVLVCALLLASYLVGITLNPVYEMRESTQESVTQLLNATTVNLPSGLHFMDGKNVVLVSHELSLSGGPLLLMELGSILRRSGAHVLWVTGNKKEITSSDPVVVNLEKKLLNHGLQILAARGARTVEAVTMADLVILNTAVAGKWIDAVLVGEATKKVVLAKTLWWIHEMRGHYFAMEYVKHLPEVAGVVIDSYATADYWKIRTRDRLRITLPKVHVVHLGNSHQLMLAAEDAVGRASMRQRVRQMLGIHNTDVVFAMINSVSRGKGQDLFLRAFVEGLKLVKEINMVQQTALIVHALLVGSDWAAPAYESVLRNFVKENELQRTVHFVNKSVDVAPYLAASDVLVQNSQGRGECFGRITIEAMAFQLPVLGTAVGGTLEIVVNGSTGRLHPVGKNGVQLLAQNIRDLTLDKSLRIRMGSRGYNRVKQRFMEHHMCERLGLVLQSLFV